MAHTNDTGLVNFMIMRSLTRCGREGEIVVGGNIKKNLYEILPL